MELGQRADVRHPARLGRQPADVEPTKVVKPAPTSWGAVFDANSPVQGQDHRVRLADLHRRRRALPDEDQAGPRIKNPYALDEKQFDAAVALLKAQKHDRRRVLVGLHQGGPGLRERQHRASARPGRSSPTWSTPTRRPVEAIVPKEGSTGWSDTWMIAAKAAAPELRVQVDELDHLARRSTPRSPSGSVRRRRRPKACDRRRRTRPSAQTYHALDAAYAAQDLVLDDADAQCLPTAAASSAWTTPPGRRPGPTIKG